MDETTQIFLEEILKDSESGLKCLYNLDDYKNCDVGKILIALIDKGLSIAVEKKDLIYNDIKKPNITLLTVLNTNNTT